MSVKMCLECYNAECRRRGTNELEVYTVTRSLTSFFKCDYCGAQAYYSMPGKVGDYEPRANVPSTGGVSDERG